MQAIEAFLFRIEMNFELKMFVWERRGWLWSCYKTMLMINLDRHSVKAIRDAPEWGGVKIFWERRFIRSCKSNRSQIPMSYFIATLGRNRWKVNGLSWKLVSEEGWDVNFVETSHNDLGSKVQGFTSDICYYKISLVKHEKNQSSNWSLNNQSKWTEIASNGTWSTKFS